MLGKWLKYNGSKPVSLKKRKRAYSKRRGKKGPLVASTLSLVPAVSPSATTASGTALSARLIYCEKDVSLNPGLGTPAVYIFRMASLFDPNLTGVGHQPARFDQYMAMYEHFVVTGSSIKVSFQNLQSAGGGATVVGLTISDSNTPSSLDCRPYIENGQTVHTLLPPRTEGDSCQQLAVYTDLAKQHGITRTMLLTDNQYKGTATADPSEGVYAHVWAQDVGTGDPAAVNMFVEITYYVVFQGNAITPLS